MILSILYNIKQNATDYIYKEKLIIKMIENVANELHVKFKLMTVKYYPLAQIVACFPGPELQGT